MSAVVLLKPCLTAENADADEVIAAMAHKTKAEVEQLVAARSPKPDLPARLVAIPPAVSRTPRMESLAPGPVAPPFAKVKPLAPERFGIQFTIDQATHDDLRQVQALLGHQVPPGDLAQVFARALKALRRELERNKFAATDRGFMDRKRGTPGATATSHARPAVGT